MLLIFLIWTFWLQTFRYDYSMWRNHTKQGSRKAPKVGNLRRGQLEPHDVNWEVEKWDKASNRLIQEETGNK